MPSAQVDLDDYITSSPFTPSATASNESSHQPDSPSLSPSYEDNDEDDKISNVSFTPSMVTHAGGMADSDDRSVAFDEGRKMKKDDILSKRRFAKRASTMRLGFNRRKKRGRDGEEMDMKMRKQRRDEGDSVVGQSGSSDNVNFYNHLTHDRSIVPILNILVNDPHTTANTATDPSSSSAHEYDPSSPLDSLSLTSSPLETTHAPFSTRKMSPHLQKLMLRREVLVDEMQESTSQSTPTAAHEAAHDPSILHTTKQQQPELTAATQSTTSPFPSTDPPIQTSISLKHFLFKSHISAVCLFITTGVSVCSALLFGLLVTLHLIFSQGVLKYKATLYMEVVDLLFLFAWVVVISALGSLSALLEWRLRKRRCMRILSVSLLCFLFVIPVLFLAALIVANTMIVSQPVQPNQSILEEYLGEDVASLYLWVLMWFSLMSATVLWVPLFFVSVLRIIVIIVQWKTGQLPTTRNRVHLEKETEFDRV
mmetsp:Transcript_959/g.3292  ORF Transcript_959/g.3292 Transcript_959/m.3292 type:complete len:481 (+) Transcript_959:352-1794(+)